MQFFTQSLEATTKSTMDDTFQCAGSARLFQLRADCLIAHGSLTKGIECMQQQEPVTSMIMTTHE